MSTQGSEGEDLSTQLLLKQPWENLHGAPRASSRVCPKCRQHLERSPQVLGFFFFFNLLFPLITKSRCEVPPCPSYISTGHSPFGAHMHPMAPGPHRGCHLRPNLLQHPVPMNLPQHPHCPARTSLHVFLWEMGRRRPSEALLPRDGRRFAPTPFTVQAQAPNSRRGGRPQEVCPACGTGLSAASPTSIPGMPSSAQLRAHAES